MASESIPQGKATFPIGEEGITISRYDKYDPKDGGFRAPLNAALTATSGPGGVTDLNRILVVGINSSGRILKSASIAACTGIIIATKAMAVADQIDVMTDGEVVEMDGSDIQGGTAGTAGQKLWYDSTASRLTATSPVAGAAGFYVGQLVEPGRLIVRCQYWGGVDGA